MIVKSGLYVYMWISGTQMSHSLIRRGIIAFSGASEAFEKGGCNLVKLATTKVYGTKMIKKM